MTFCKHIGNFQISFYKNDWLQCNKVVDETFDLIRNASMIEENKYLMIQNQVNMPYEEEFAISKPLCS